MVLGVHCRSRCPLLVGDVQVFHTKGPGLGEEWSRYLSDSEKWLFIHSLKKKQQRKQQTKKLWIWLLCYIRPGCQPKQKQVPIWFKGNMEIQIQGDSSYLYSVVPCPFIIWHYLAKFGKPEPTPTPSPRQIFVILYCLWGFTICPRTAIGTPHHSSPGQFNMKIRLFTCYLCHPQTSAEAATQIFPHSVSVGDFWKGSHFNFKC